MSSVMDRPDGPTLITNLDLKATPKQKLKSDLSAT